MNIYIYLHALVHKKMILKCTVLAVFFRSGLLMYVSKCLFTNTSYSAVHTKSECSVWTSWYILLAYYTVIGVCSGQLLTLSLPSNDVHDIVLPHAYSVRWHHAWILCILVWSQLLRINVSGSLNLSPGLFSERTGASITICMASKGLTHL